MLTNDKIAQQPIPCYLTSNPSGGVDHSTCRLCSAMRTFIEVHAVPPCLRIACICNRADVLLLDDSLDF